MTTITILSVFPSLHETFLQTSLIKLAQEKGLVDIKTLRFSDFCQPLERIDEPTCGPGPGMVIKPEVMQKAIEAAEAASGKGYKIFFSPQGECLDQPLVKHLAQQFFSDVSPETHSNKPETNHLILICSRYEGIDQRVQDMYADLVISIGDFVVMGGDIPSQLFLEAILRYMPGVVGNQSSVEHDSFTGPLLDHPTYGLPVEWQGKKVPEVLLSGNHAAIDQWRFNEALTTTIKQRFDWFRAQSPTEEQIEKSQSVIPPHYLVEMHTDVLVENGRPGTTSVASLDIHDIARSAKTYGIKGIFLATPLHDQQKIVRTFLDFWHSDEGKKYNKSRYDAVAAVEIVNDLAATIEAIEKKEGQKPVLVITSARPLAHARTITYNDQSVVWAEKRPVLFVFGTGQGLSPAVTDKADFVLVPVNGLSSYNHLSVRAAVAIILDRWLGLQPAKSV